MNNVLNEESSEGFYYNKSKSFDFKLMYKKDPRDLQVYFQKEKDCMSFFPADFSESKSSSAKKNALALARRCAIEKDNNGEKIKINGIFSGADMEFAIYNGPLECNILIKEKADMYRCTFRLKTSDLKIRPGDNGQDTVISTIRPYKEIFRISPCYMVDMNGTVTDSISCKIHNVNKSDTLITLTADKEWLNAPDRVFPVCIKSLVLTEDESCFETYQYEKGQLFWSPGACSVGVLGKNESKFDSEKIHRMYICAILPLLSSDTKVKKAELCIRQSACNIDTTQERKLGLYYISDEIIPNSCACYPDDDSRLIDTVKIQNGSCQYKFDITSLFINDRYPDEPSKNLMVKFTDEKISENEILYLADRQCKDEIALVIAK